MLQWRTVDQLGGAWSGGQGGFLASPALSNFSSWYHQEIIFVFDQDERYKLRWKNSCDMSHSWNGIVRLLPGQVSITLIHINVSSQHVLPDLVL